MRQKPPLDPNYEPREVNKNKKHLLNGREKTFSEFLFYRFFHSADFPTILTEGHTDNLYLKSAINMLASTYPRLGAVKTANSPYQLLLKFISYSPRTKFLLELHGGADYLHGFIRTYEKKFERYKAPTNKHPVIIVVDNDSGPNQIVALVSRHASASIFPTTLNLQTDVRKADFIHIAKNLYLVMTPLSSGNLPSDIEGLFSDHDRLIQHNGKCFNTVKNRDNEKDLSKDAFATHVISAQKSKIDFNGLKPLFDRVVLAIEHYDSIR